MIESPKQRRAIYAWEHEKFRDLEIPLDRDRAQSWFRMILIELGLYNHAVSFGYYKDKNEKYHGRTVVGECPWSNGRAAHIKLYPPHHLRTLGHEFAHVKRCERDGIHGHGGDWRTDVSKVYAIIRKHMSRIEGTLERS